MKKALNPCAVINKKALLGLWRAMIACMFLCMSFAANGKTRFSPDHSVSFQQRYPLTGRVVDAATGESLTGVSVVLKGSGTGASTDTEGNYSLDIPDSLKSGILIFSLLGHLTQEVAIDGRNTVNVSLEKGIASLDEVVVVGYGTQEKRDLTGAVSSVSAEEITKVVATNVAQAIQGRVPGVNISQNSWAPGAGATVRIRGRRSITASADPLYVIDGTPISRGTITINDISPSNIASVEVLKDASATAIYGARGANGVILITTKRGYIGKTTVNYNSYAGFQQPLNPIEVYNGAEYAEYIRESFRNSPTHTYNSSGPDPEEDKAVPQFAQDPFVLESVLMAYDENGNYAPARVRDFNWLDAVRRTGFIQNHYLSVSGGSEKTRFLASSGYYGNKGHIKNMQYKRYNIRVNVDHDLNEKIKLSTSAYISRADENIGPNLVGGARDLNPLARPRDDEGNWIFNPGNDPLTINTLLDIDGVRNESRKNRLLANVKLDVGLIKGLEYRLNAAYDYRTARDGSFQSSTSAARNRQTPTAFYGGNSSTDILVENMLFFRRNFNEKHDLEVTVVQSFQDRDFETFSGSVEGLPYESQLFYNIGSGSEINGVSSSIEEWQMLSFMGRVNYNLFDKYLFTVTGRSDGSSRLAPGNKYHFFPSAAFAWRISNEEFLEGAGFINDLKIRLSYGKTGNSAIVPYQTQGSLGLRRYAWGEQVAIGYRPDDMPNPALTWETTAQANIGIDFELFNHRISGSVNGYVANTTDLLMPRKLPVVTGFESVLTNVGQTRNTGFEISLSTVNVDYGRSFRWSTDLVFSHNKEEIVSLIGGKVDDVGNQWFIGQPIDVFFNRDAIGIWQDTEAEKPEMAKFNDNGHSFEPGDVKIKDQNGDYRINSDDRVILGSSRPKWTAGLSNQLAYKNFDLSFQVYVSFGAMGVFDQNLQLNGRYNMIAVDYWTPEHPTNRYPKPNFAWLTPDYIYETYYEDASYARLKFVTLGYTFSPKVLQRTGINGVRVYVSAQNPYLFTNFTGPDPEGAQGMETASPKTFLGGIEVSF